MKQILLINDLAGYGKVATAAMLPVLSYMGYSVYNLPTALVSNTLDYGKFNILDTTEYIKGVFPVWKELGFSFDAIATGLIASEKQAQIISQYCKEQKEKGTFIFTDPIMGDEGKLYNGVTEEAIRSMKEIITNAHLIYPNYTEACYLTEREYKKNGVSKKEVFEMIDDLRAFGCKSVLITSVIVDNKSSVAGYDATIDDYFILNYTEIPVHFPGTGDLFSAILIGNLMKGCTLKDSTGIAAEALYKLIELNKDNKDKNKGIPVENFLHIM